MSKEERDNESILLSEHWNLIQSGTDREPIKIRSKQISVNNQLHGNILDSKLSKINASTRSITDNGGATNSDMVIEDQAPDEGLVDYNSNSNSKLDSNNNAKNIYQSSSNLTVLCLNCSSVRSIARRARFHALVHENLPDIIVGCDRPII